MAPLRASALAAVALLCPSSTDACSWILFNRKDYPVLSARTLDWAYAFDDNLLVNPRGQQMDGGCGSVWSKRWTSKYGSVAASVNGWLSQQVSNFTGESFDWYRDGGSEAVNEAGFAAHALYLETTEYGALLRTGAGVTYMRWVRYLVDNFATVAEALAGMRDVEVADLRIIDGKKPGGLAMGIHIAMEDRTGDAAIIEIRGGKMLVYHGRSQNYTVMTNDPQLPDQLRNLRRYTTFGGKQPIPGGTTPRDRFVRMSYYLKYVPESHDSTTMAAYLRSIIMASAVPQGAPDEEASGYEEFPTWWMSILDLQELVYYWGWNLNPNVLWVDLNWLREYGWFMEGKPYAWLNPRQRQLAGDVSDAFRIQDASTFLRMVGGRAAPLRAAIRGAANGEIGGCGLLVVAFAGLFTFGCLVNRLRKPCRADRREQHLLAA